MTTGCRNTLVELCAGSAALTRHVLGKGKLLGFMGGKDRYAEQIVKHWGLPKPDQIVLNDPGFWGTIWAANKAEQFHHMASLIDFWADEDGRELFNRLKKDRGAFVSLPSRSRARAPCGDVRGWGDWRFQGSTRKTA